MFSTNPPKSAPKISSEKKKKKKSTQHIHSFSPPSGMTCTPDQCFISTPSVAPAQPAFSFNKNSFTSQNTLNKAAEKTNLPTELSEAIMTAAKKGFAIAFLSTLTEEYMTDYLKERDYTPRNIFYINQAIKALTLLSMGISLGRTIASPLLNLFLTDIAKQSNNTANIATLALFLAAEVYARPDNLTETMATFSAGLLCSAAGSKLAQSGYQRGSGLVHAGIFSVKKVMTKLMHSESTQPTIKLTC
jgi:hypothetical protein